MENSTFSTLKILEPIKQSANRTYMPYKQIGFFQNKLLGKNIGTLKSDLESCEKFIKINNYLTKKNNVSKINRINKHVKTSEQDKTIIENKKTLENDNQNYIYSKDNINKNSKTRNLNLIKNIEAQKKILIDSKDLSLASNDKFYSCDQKDKKYIKLVTLNPKYPKEVKNNKSNINKQPNRNPNIIKNQLISSHLKKEDENNCKVSEISSILSANNSNLSSPKKNENGDSEVNSKMNREKGSLQHKNSNVVFLQECLKFNFNFIKGSNLPNKEIIDPKTDFIYKKIFDTKTRNLFNKDNNNNELTKKKSKKLDKQTNNYLNLIHNSGPKKSKYVENKIDDIKKKLFFIKGIFDYSYPNIIVNKVKTAQNFFNAHNSEQLSKLRDSLNNTSHKIMEIFEDNLKNKSEIFKKSFYVEKLTSPILNDSLRNDFLQNESRDLIDVRNRMAKSTTNFDFKSIRKAQLSLTNKFIKPNEIQPIKIYNPINIKSIYPDLGESKKLLKSYKN